MDPIPPAAATLGLRRHEAEADAALRGLTTRIFGYFTFVGLLFAGTVKLAEKIGPAAVVDEGCTVEVIQQAILILTALSYLVLAASSAANRAVYALLTIAAIFAIEREFSYFLIMRETWVCVVKHSAQVLLVGGTLIAARRTVLRQVQTLAARPSFLLLLVGFVMVTLWAQVLGQKAVWRAIQSANQVGKWYVEEHLELAGYFLILASVLEEGLSLRRERRAKGAAADASGEVPATHLIAVEANGRSSSSPERVRAA